MADFHARLTRATGLEWDVGNATKSWPMSRREREVYRDVQAEEDGE